MKNKYRIKLYPLIFIGLVFVFINSCRKDDNTKVADTVMDADGNLYHAVTIGTQVWMVENLKVTRYRNGDIIGTTTPANLDISGETNPKYQWAYKNNEVNVTTYGRLYTWYAITDSRNVCPIGWHIPTDTEWTTLENYLTANGYNYDGSTTGNKYAKSLASNSDWASCTNMDGAVGNTDYPAKQNLTGFTAFPGGWRNPNGTFNFFGYVSNWWSSTEPETTHAFFRYLDFSHFRVYKDVGVKGYGFSVRCLKDPSI